jgi:hypothetical protein
MILKRIIVLCEEEEEEEEEDYVLFGIVFIQIR